MKAATCIKEATGKPKTDRTGVNALPSFKAYLPYQDQLAIPSHPVLGKLLTNVSQMWNMQIPRHPYVYIYMYLDLMCIHGGIETPVL